MTDRKVTLKKTDKDNTLAITVEDGKNQRQYIMEFYGERSSFIGWTEEWKNYPVEPYFKIKPKVMLSSADSFVINGVEYAKIHMNLPVVDGVILDYDHLYQALRRVGGTSGDATQAARNIISDDESAILDRLNKNEDGWLMIKIGVIKEMQNQHEKMMKAISNLSGMMALYNTAIETEEMIPEFMTYRERRKK